MVATILVRRAGMDRDATRSAAGPGRLATGSARRRRRRPRSAGGGRSTLAAGRCATTSTWTPPAARALGDRRRRRRTTSLGVARRRPPPPPRGRGRGACRRGARSRVGVHARRPAGRNEKMPAAVVVDRRRSPGRSRAGVAPSSPLTSWRKATSPMQQRRSGALGRRAATPDRGGHDAVDAVGAPVGVHLHAARRAARTTRGRGSASTTTRRAGRRSGGRRPRARATPGSVGPGSAVEHGDRWRPGRPRPGPASGRASAAVDGLHARRPRRPRHRAGDSASSGRTTVGGAAGDRTTRRRRRRRSPRAPDAGEPLARDPGGQRAAEADDRPPGGRSTVGAQQGVGGGDGHRRCPTPAAWGAASTGQPSARGDELERPRRIRSPLRRPARPGGRPGRRRRLMVGSAGAAVGGRQAHAPVCPAPGGSGSGAPSSGSRKARLRCTGPGAGPVASA